MIELILYGFIVWHICCFIMNVVGKENQRTTFRRWMNFRNIFGYLK